MARYEMSREERTALRQNRVFLVRNVDYSSGILDHLYGENLITYNMLEDVKAERTKSDIIRKLLDLLPRRGPTAFPVFIECLKKTEQEHVADKLEEDLAKLSGGQASKPVAEVGEAGKAKGETQEDVDGKNPFSEVTHVKRQLAEKLMSDKENPVYPMRSKPRGRAIIINNHFFTDPKLKTRDGAKKDLDNLCRLFEQLGFVVDSHKNCTAKEIIEILEKESQHKDHANADCFICFVLSHGTKDFVYGMDGEKVSIDNQIVAPFYSDRCCSLQRKPKIFFFQACQDTPAAKSSESSQDQTNSKPVADGITKGLEDLQLDDKDEDVPTIAAHEMSDLVLAYATVPGYKSWRSPQDGSWFVLAIAEIFTEYAHRDDLYSMLLKVRRRVETTHAIYHKDQAFKQRTKFPQLPLTTETAYKKIFFFPGYYAS